MWAVVIALIPAAGMGIWFFGLRVIALIIASVITAVLTEFLIQKFRKVKVDALDGSAVITGLLLALIVPPALPIIYIIFGSFFSVAIGKQVFGGLGRNIWNPALVGRAFMQVSFAQEMNTFTTVPRGAYEMITTTSATPLAMAKATIDQGAAAADIYAGITDWMPLAWGNIKGCVGETSAVAIIAGGLFLVFLKIVDWRIPLFYIGTAVLFCWILPVKVGGQTAWFASDPVFHLFAGGLLLGGFFMATDMVTTPITPKGRIIFACGAGLLVALIRIFGGFPEGVCYSILIMNTTVPLIDRFTAPKPFGKSPKKEKKNG
jgi:electron transport complex protein RnfD